MAYYKYTHEVPLKKGARGFIERMRAEGKKIGIATSNSRMLAEDTLKALGVWELFDCVKTSEEAGAGKPAPDVYLLAAEISALSSRTSPQGSWEGRMRACGCAP